MKIDFKNTLIVAVDAGFDGGKVVVNGKAYHMPFTVKDITDMEEKYSMQQMTDEYLLLRSSEKTFLVGSMARKAMLSSLNTNSDTDNNIDKSAFFTMKRYETKEFEYALDATIIYGIYNYFKSIGIAEENMARSLSKYKVYVSVALPHSFTKSLVTTVDTILVKDKEYNLVVGGRQPIAFNFKIEDTYYNSQMKAMFYNEVTDDYGNLYESEENLYNNLPVLIIDAGYKTIGKSVFTLDERIVGDDSNMTFAMTNVNALVEEELKDIRPDIKSFLIDEIIKRQPLVGYKDSENKRQFVDVAEIKNKALDQITKELYTSLLEEFNDLLDVNNILIGGGTGDVYYDYLSKLFEESHPGMNLIKAGQRPFFGVTYEPIFSIACGLFKDFLCQLSD